jgi:hypothetical protein
MKYSIVNKIYYNVKYMYINPLAVLEKKQEIRVGGLQNFFLIKRKVV